ncbi:MAG: hypothetical protein ACRD0Z_03540 [Acidimicrobiales bacterium]
MRALTVATAAVLLVCGYQATLAAGAPRTSATVVPRPVLSGILNAGEKGMLLDTVGPLGASAIGSMVLEIQQRLGNGQLVVSGYDTSAGPNKPLEAFAAPSNSPGLGEVSNVGDYATGEYVVGSSTYVLIRDELTNLLQHVKLPTGATYEGSSSRGFLVEEESGGKFDVDQYDVSTGKYVIDGSYTDDATEVVPGPDGYTTLMDNDVDYTTYAGKTETIDTVTSEYPPDCTSVSSDAAGCLQYDPTTSSYEVERLPIPEGKPVDTLLKADVYTEPAVTSTETGWVNCGVDTTCTLERQAAVGGGVTRTTLPRIEGGDYGLTASSTDFYYGTLENTTTGGAYRLPSTSDTPDLVAPAPPSPLAAATVDLSVSATGAVTAFWEDSSKPKIGIFDRSVSVSDDKLDLGPEEDVATADFVFSDATSYSLSLGSSGSDTVYSSYEKQPTANPIALDLDESGKVSTITADGNYSPQGEGYGPTAGAPVSIAGNFALFTNDAEPPVYELYDVSDGHTCLLPSTGVSQYALGPGPADPELAWVTTSGEIFKDSPNCAPKGTLLYNPHVSATELYTVSLGVSGNYVAWAYQWYSSSGSGAIADYYNVTTKVLTKIPSPIVDNEIVAMSVAAADLGITVYTSTGSDLYGISLPSGTVTLLTVDAYDLSVGGGYAAWIGANSSSPYVARI